MVIRWIATATVASATLCAQQFTTSATLLSPLTCSASTGGAPVVKQTPAGLQPPNSTLMAFAYTAAFESSIAMARWQTESSASKQVFRLDLSALNNSYYAANPAMSADVGPVDMLLEFDAPPAQVPVSYTIRFTPPNPASAPCYGFSVDIDNDGVVDWAPTQGGNYNAVGTMGPQPLSMRLNAALSQAGNGEVGMSVTITVVPDLGIDIQQITSGCAPGWPPFLSPGTYLVTAPVLQPNGGDVNFEMPNSAFSVPVHVIGLSSAPTPLSSFGLPSSSVGIPSPDLLRIQPLLSLSIPAAVRPVTLYAQALSLGNLPTLNLGIATSDAYRVIAH